METDQVINYQNGKPSLNFSSFPFFENFLIYYKLLLQLVVQKLHQSLFHYLCILKIGSINTQRFQ